MPKTVELVETKLLEVIEWSVRRVGTITWEQTVEGEIQYTVRIKDAGRNYEFNKQSFGSLASAMSYIENFQKGNQ